MLSGLGSIERSIRVSSLQSPARMTDRLHWKKTDETAIRSTERGS